MNSSTINLILSFLFLLVLIAGFFIGFWRGLRKSALNMAFSLIGAVVAFFITPLITNAILSINIDYNGTAISLNQYFVAMLKENKDISNMIESNPNMETLIEKLPGAVANVVLFIVVSLLVALVLYIIYKIIAVLCLKNKQYQNKHRVLGGVVGLAKTFIVFLFVFMPLSSLLGLFDNIQQRENIYKSEKITLSTSSSDYEVTVLTGEQESSEKLSVIGQMLPKEVSEIVSGLNQNFFFQMCGLTGLDDAMFDYYGSVEINGEKLLIRKEINSYAKAYDVSVQISQISSNDHNFSQLNFDVVEPYFNEIINGGFFKQIVVELLQDIVTNYQNYPFLQNNQFFEEYSQILNNISDSLNQLAQESADRVVEYFKNDLQTLFDIFKTISENGVLDQIVESSNKSASAIVEILIKNENINVLTYIIEKVFDLNLLQDSLDVVLNKFLPTIVDNVGDFVVDTSNWAEEKWNNLATEIKNVATSFKNISQNIDVFETIKDPVILLTNDKIDLSATMSSLGAFIDQILDISIFNYKDENENEKNILSNLLVNYNISLPNYSVYNKKNEEISITSYQNLFEFLSSSLNSIKKSGLYTILTNDKTETTDKIKAIANKLTENQELLSDIITPIYQIEFTKDLIVDDLLIEGLGTTVIDFSSLPNYGENEQDNLTLDKVQEWRKELNQISNILVLLNKEDSNGILYLDYVLNGDMDNLLNNLGTNLTLSEILRPVLYSKMLNDTKQSLFDAVSQAINSLTGEQVEISIEGITFESGSEEDQTEEVCNVFEKFLSIYKTYSNNQGSLGYDDIDKKTLGELLDSLKENAYRVELSKNQEKQKNEKGIFKDAFDKLINSFKNEFDPDDKLINANKNIYDISFTNLMGLIEDLENAAENSFVSYVAGFINSEEITTENLDKMIQTITEDNKEEVEELLNTLESFEISVEIPASIDKEKVIEQIDSIGITVGSTITTQLKNFLGLANEGSL